MSSDVILPKRVVAYIHQMGVRALDRLANSPGHAPKQEPVSAEGAEEMTASPDALQTLVQQWHQMTIEQKRHFVDEVTASVVAVVSASAALPLTLKMEKIAAKATKKVLKREKKKLKKAAKAASKKKDEAASAKKKKAKPAKATKPAAAAKAKPKAKSAKKAPKKKVARVRKPAAAVAAPSPASI